MTHKSWQWSLHVLLTWLNLRSLGVQVGAVGAADLPKAGAAGAAGAVMGHHRLGPPALWHRQDLRDLQEVTGEMVMGVTKAILGSCWAGC